MTRPRIKTTSARASEVPLPCPVQLPAGRGAPGGIGSQRQPRAVSPCGQHCKTPSPATPSAVMLGVRTKHASGRNLVAAEIRQCHYVHVGRYSTRRKCAKPLSKAPFRKKSATSERGHGGKSALRFHE